MHCNCIDGIAEVLGIKDFHSIRNMDGSEQRNKVVNRSNCVLPKTKPD